MAKTVLVLGVVLGLVVVGVIAYSFLKEPEAASVSGNHAAGKRVHRDHTKLSRGGGAHRLHPVWKVDRVVAQSHALEHVGLEHALDVSARHVTRAHHVCHNPVLPGAEHGVDRSAAPALLPVLTQPSSCWFLKGSGCRAPALHKCTVPGFAAGRPSPAPLADPRCY